MAEVAGMPCYAGIKGSKPLPQLIPSTAGQFAERLAEEEEDDKEVPDFIPVLPKMKSPPLQALLPPAEKPSNQDVSTDPSATYAKVKKNRTKENFPRSKAEKDNSPSAEMHTYSKPPDQLVEHRQTDCKQIAFYAMVPEFQHPFSTGREVLTNSDNVYSEVDLSQCKSVNVYNEDPTKNNTYASVAELTAAPSVPPDGRRGPYPTHLRNLPCVNPLLRHYAHPIDTSRQAVGQQLCPQPPQTRPGAVVELDDPVYGTAEQRTSTLREGPRQDNLYERISEDMFYSPRNY
nr:PREDICTED: uncharacterized protein LOC106702769 [Latimeria chalumnae]|eukprot:XP_014341415.1 PREDICTED: uncharacterized protein LOC106702769 [Latimeria chalumnae]